MSKIAGLFWVFFFGGAYLAYKAGLIDTIGKVFVDPLLPADSKCDGSQLIICCLILMFFSGAAVATKK